MDSTSIERHLTPPQIAEALGVDPATVLDWIKAGELRARKLGSGVKRPRYRVALSALEAFLASRETTAPPKPTRRIRKAQETDFVAMMRLGRER